MPRMDRKNAVVLIIRHAENAGQAADGLSPTGSNGPKAYKDYFLNFTVDSKPREPQVIFVAEDSKQSHRPRLTVEPFAKAAKLPIDTPLWQQATRLIWRLNCVQTSREK